MADIKAWCTKTVTKLKLHSLTYLEAHSHAHASAISSVAAVVPDHYAAPDRVANILRRLGKPAVADYVQTKLPQGIKSRSGDLGEILATSYVSEFTSYKVGVYKLRWSDHREMAMRGDDILGIRLDPTLTVKFLKGEVKSRATLGKKTVDEARAALNASNGRPTPHALAYVADRLFETGETALAEIIDQFQLKARINTNQVSHLMFMFTGNNPSNLLTLNLNAYSGKIRQFAVGLRVASHQDFIKQVFEKAIDDGNKP
ncbi:Hachiman antiphage defense system protein HamA [Methylobacterium sp. WCS2018Hpa-22]|uniref:Hachiman antiphage defense system protein HamA n=1 Tax=Methylobacterium sp. WCS2018Hpa-22 TaxID=3073633 RepID=UPI0028893F32|nr:Hachiman antiphage defense system protein HamA [Methylobacterium sp. WCS2018Hpa-22]